jgi:dihydrofolate synthase/folylpolyglutamate synthase
LAELAYRRLRGASLPAEAIAAGSRDVCWPGRMEELPSLDNAPRMLLDGAHNDYSIKTVLSDLRALLPECRPVVVVFGCARDKDAPAMLRLVAEMADAVVFTTSASQRSREPAELAMIWRELTGREAPVKPDLGEAVSEAQRLAVESGRPGLVLVTGSLYLVGAFKRQFRM